MLLRDRVRAGLRATGQSVCAVGLALLNVPVLALWLAGLVLSPVPVLGADLLHVTTVVVRWRADLERRLGALAGVPIRRPYPPPPDRADLGSRRWLRWIITDPATWRDMAWLLPGALVGVALGVITVAIVAYGLAGVALVPLWLFLGTIWFGYGIFWPTADIGEAWLALPQGLILLAVGLGAAPDRKSVV
jgi:hypothetical protein